MPAGFTSLARHSAIALRSGAESSVVNPGPAPSLTFFLNRRYKRRELRQEGGMEDGRFLVVGPGPRRAPGGTRRTEGGVP